ncbi:tetratricopeptide repeat protein [Hwangdonia lutea]|uniref:Tetratricopeptide repeat protein n=1 Tax=Hwangdonia lutea TaxID=3075823 RepID=A0AA97HS99_9FLAO|nr:tetratricopeptide repeat protein [Hwangdonia sp. SCSIO 19198]WOD44638.1 tetratricopeptide repeat protein [Hwangdonia sp. SCSIO 19198]
MSRIILIVFIISSFKTEAQTSVLNIADNLFAHGNYSKAIAQYKKHDNLPEVYHKIAKAYIAIGNYDEALVNYEKGVETNPNNTLLKYDFGKFLYRTKNFKRASEVFNKLVYTDYKNPNFHYELGLTLEQLKDSTAQNRFYSAFQLDSTHQKAIYKIAKFHLKKGHNKLVDKYIDVGLSSYKNNKQLISLKAQNYYVRHQFENAIVWFEKLLELGESSEFIHEKLSLSYAQLFEFEKAITQRELALKFNPLDATAIYVIGTYYEKIDDFKNAEKNISKALSILDQPLDVEYVKLATVLNRQKKYKEGIEAIKKAVKENPTNEFSNFHLAITLEAYYADYDAKIKVFEDFKKKFPNGKLNGYADERISKLKKEKFLKVKKKAD